MEFLYPDFYSLKISNSILMTVRIIAMVIAFTVLYFSIDTNAAISVTNSNSDFVFVF
jgi:hypothetical protein